MSAKTQSIMTAAYLPPYAVPTMTNHDLEFPPEKETRSAKKSAAEQIAGGEEKTDQTAMGRWRGPNRSNDRVRYRVGVRDSGCLLSWIWTSGQYRTAIDRVVYFFMFVRLQLFVLMAWELRLRNRPHLIGPRGVYVDFYLLCQPVENLTLFLKNTV